MLCNETHDLGDLSARIIRGKQKVKDEAERDNEIVYRKFLSLFLQKFWNSSECFLSVRFDEFNPDYSEIGKVMEKYSINDDMLERIHGAIIHNYSNDNKIIFLDIDNKLFPVLRDRLESYIKGKGFNVLSSVYGVGFSIARDDFYNRIINKNGIIVREDLIDFLKKCKNDVEDEAEKNIIIVYEKFLSLFLQKFWNSSESCLTVKLKEFNLNDFNIENVNKKYSIDDFMLGMIQGAINHNCSNDNKIIFLEIDNQLFPVFRNELVSYIEENGFYVLSSYVNGIGFWITREDFYKGFINKDATIVHDDIYDDIGDDFDDGIFGDMIVGARDMIHGVHKMIKVGTGNCKKRIKRLIETKFNQ